MKPAALPVLLGLAGLSAARTDLGGCVSSLTMNQYHEASLLWYVPDNGEICSIPDCGGGRAPPKNKPGCGGYTGTATLTPDYLPGWGPNGKTISLTETAASTSTSTAHSTADAESVSASSDSGSSMVTAAPSSSPVVSIATVTLSGSAASGSAAKGSASSSAASISSASISSASASSASESSASESSASGSSTSAAPSSSSTDNAAGHSASNMAGVLAAVAAVFGAMAL